MSVSTIGRIERGDVADSAAIPILETYLGIPTDDDDTGDDAPQDAEQEPRWTLHEARRRLPAWELLAELAERLGTDAPPGAPLPEHPYETDSRDAPSQRRRDGHEGDMPESNH